MFQSFNKDEIEKTLSPYLSWIQGFDPEDWGRESQNIALTDNDEDFALFEYDRPQVYWGHIFCRKRRGREALTFGKEALDLIFQKAKVIKGLTPFNNKAALLFVRKLSFKGYDVVEARGELHHLSILTKQEWKDTHG